jgi:ATP-dependent phosphofructokinase / diphosphate-dependent phosphofructokinase
MKKIGILTGGADCPGLNSVIRAVVRKSMLEGYVVTGIKNGWTGLIENDMRILDLRAVSGILDRGGTILGTSRLNPYENGPNDVEKITENFLRSGIDAVIAVGGEETLKVALRLHKENRIKVVGVPKSIDNALSGTDYAFGFDTAVNVATECIDRLHTTAESHHRIMVVEVMGRYTGWIALQAGIAGGADIILIPELLVDMKKVCDSIKARHERGKTFSIIIVSEGTHVKQREQEKRRMKEVEHRRFGEVGEYIAKTIEDETGFETRVSVLGHIQRGGTPTAYDRVIGTQFGIKAVELVKEKQFGKMVSLRGSQLQSVDIEYAVKERKTVDMELYEMAKVFSASHE